MRFSSLLAFVALVTGPIALAHSYDHIYERDLSVHDISAIQAREILSVLYDLVERRSLANDEFVDLAVRAPNHLGVPVVPSPGPNIQDSRTKLPKKRSRRDISVEDLEDLVTRAPNHLGVPVVPSPGPNIRDSRTKLPKKRTRRDLSFEDLENLVTRSPNHLSVPVVASPDSNIQHSRTKLVPRRPFGRASQPRKRTRRDISFDDLEDLVTRGPNHLTVPTVSSGTNIQDSKTKLPPSKKHSRDLSAEDFEDLAARGPNQLGVPVVSSPGPNIQDSRTKLPKKRV